MILLAAVVVAFVVGMIDDASDGWIESVAILTAVVIVSQVIDQPLALWHSASECASDCASVCASDCAS